MEFELTWLALGFAALAAGFVDAIAGGGGLIQIPALMAAYPQELPARLFGTNKLASIIGTASAAVRYGRRIPIPWSVALPGALAALVGAWLGARFVSALDPALLRPMVMVLLLVVAAYTYFKKDFGQDDLDHDQPVAPWVPMGIGGAVGFYDGFFGPGTGSFFIFLLIHLVGLDFLRASVTAKILNVATNLAAISYFAMTDSVMWRLGILMALCNLIGAQLGSRLALARGTSFVRQVFLVVVLVLVGKLGLDLLG